MSVVKTVKGGDATKFVFLIVDDTGSSKDKWGKHVGAFLLSVVIKREIQKKTKLYSGSEYMALPISKDSPSRNFMAKTSVLFYKKLKQNKYFYLLLIPAVVTIFIFSYLPMYGIVIAFKDYKFMKGISGSEWVGLEHFRNLFAIQSFYDVLRNTLLISLYRILFGFPAPIVLAILLNEVKASGFKKVVQSISYLPHFLSWVVLAGLMTTILSLDTGIVNIIIDFFGGKQIHFLADSSWFRTILVSSGIWQSVGWGSIIYLAVIAGINPELYEVAEMDGANRFHRALYITIPSLVPVATILLLLNIGSVLQAGFDQIFNLYNMNVIQVADVIDTYVYRRGLIQSDFSFATAVGLFQNVIGFGLILGANYLIKKFNNENGIW